MLIRFALSAFMVLALSCATTDRTTPSGKTAEDPTIAFLERRVADDPVDYSAWNRLASAYLQQLRLTGNHDYLDGALRAAESSLQALDAPVNRAGLTLLARARYANHEFAIARDLALRLIEIDDADPMHWGLLSDAYIELGEYDEARTALTRMYDAGGSTLASQTRVARQHLLHGRTTEARNHFLKALRHAETPEDIAWVHWQLGEVAFAQGDLDQAEKEYETALAAFPNSIPALGARAKVLAARGEIDRAINAYEKSIESDPVPPFVAALSDLYRARGDVRRADELMRVVDEGARSPRDRRLDRRHLATIYADRDYRLDEAYQLAVADYAERQDIHAADTLAWAAYKTGRIDEASRAIAQATRLGTKDARIHYHAAMIARAAGDVAASRKWLSSALSLNPHFDFRHSKIAMRTLSDVEIR